jgi:hypothetical protein
MVTTGSQKITVWGPGGTPLGILRVKAVLDSQFFWLWLTLVILLAVLDCVILVAVPD